jgi:hypothetical protein
MKMIFSVGLENNTMMDGEEGTVGGVLSDFVETAQELPHLSV